MQRMGSTCSAIRTRHTQQGFTLIEVMFGAAILAIAVLGVSSMATASQKLTQSSEEKGAALEAVEEKLREIEATDYDQIAAVHHQTGFSVTATDVLNNMLPPLVGDADGMPGNVQVAVPAPPGDGNSMLQIDVRVDWVGSSGPRALTRTTFLSRLGQG